MVWDPKVTALVGVCRCGFPTQVGATHVFSSSAAGCKEVGVGGNTMQLLSLSHPHQAAR